jgi:integrase
MALQAQTALAIALLLYVPIRLRNLVNLHVERNFVRSGRRSNQIVHLVVHESEVKNEEPIEFPLPRYLVGLLDEYLRAWRLQLVKRPDRGWLWPGRQQAPKHTSTMQMQIIDAVRRHVGVDVNVHLFRHLAAKLLLQESPGNYEGARRLLGHRSIDTTTTFYTGFDTAAAARHYHAMLEARRGRSKR